MANGTSTFTNVDHSIVRIKFYSTGTENMKLYPDGSDSLIGPSDDSFTFAWKDRDEEITDEEMQEYGDQAVYGEDFEFGTPRGRVP